MWTRFLNSPFSGPFIAILVVLVLPFFVIGYAVRVLVQPSYWKEMP